MTNKNQFPQSSEKVDNQPDKLKEARDLIDRYNRLTIQPVIELASGAMTMDMLLAAQDLISRHEERERCAELVQKIINAEERAGFTGMVQKILLK